MGAIWRRPLEGTLEWRKEWGLIQRLLLKHLTSGPNREVRCIICLHQVSVKKPNKEASSTKSILYIRLCKRLGENGYMCIHGWVPLLCPCNCHKHPLRKASYSLKHGTSIALAARGHPAHAHGWRQHGPRGPPMRTSVLLTRCSPVAPTAALKEGPHLIYLYAPSAQQWVFNTSPLNC